MIYDLWFTIAQQTNVNFLTVANVTKALHFGFCLKLFRLNLPLMKCYKDLSALPKFKNAVVTIGTFDGVHLGHQQILAQLKAEAKRIGGETVIITFNPHPRKIVSSIPGDIKLITTQKEKRNLLKKAGIDHLVIVPFNYQFANQSAEQYIVNFLYEYFKPHTIVIGYDHRFGKDRAGDYLLLELKGKELGFVVKEIPEHILTEAKISSTNIRQSLLQSDIETANALLGYDYFFEGLVIEGNKLGRTIGYPTANLHIENEEKLIPGNGVYAVRVEVVSRESLAGSFVGMMNIGVRPTVDGKKRMIEVNIFDFNKDIYGETLRVSITHYIRGEVKFNGLEELKTQLEKDRFAAMKLLK
jgi:riboflavin kinase/FMN adenylyltransferase